MMEKTVEMRRMWKPDGKDDAAVEDVEDEGNGGTEELSFSDCDQI